MEGPFRLGMRFFQFTVENLTSESSIVLILEADLCDFTAHEIFTNLLRQSALPAKFCHEPWHRVCLLIKSTDLYLSLLWQRFFRSCRHQFTICPAITATRRPLSPKPSVFAKIKRSVASHKQVILLVYTSHVT